MDYKRIGNTFLWLAVITFITALLVFFVVIPNISSGHYMPANEFWHYSKYVLALNIVSIVFYWIMLFFEKKDYEQED